MENSNYEVPAIYKRMQRKATGKVIKANIVKLSHEP